MDQNSPEPVETPATTPEAPANTFNRRALLRAGAASTPVLLSVVSRPVAAAGSGCMVASSFVSVATFKSRNPTGTVGCGSQNCSAWLTKANTNYKAGVGCATPEMNVKVNSVFGTTGCTWDGKLICDVFRLGVQASGDLAVLQRALSLHLNLTVQPVNILTGNGLSTAYLKNMWTSYYPTKTFKASSGVVWNNAGLIKYLNAMLGDPYPF
jgi:hypothetical protein